MASNCAAFILGGEEMLRTKEYVGINPDNVEGVNITADSWTELHGHKISHNSYNAPLDVNTFKWGNKIKVTLDNQTVTDAVSQYNLKFRELIQSHKGLLKKRGENNGYNAFVSKTYAGEGKEGKGVWNRYWSKSGNFSNCIGFQANEAFIYISAGNINTTTDCIEISNEDMAKWDQLLTYGGYNFDSPGYIYFTRTNTVLLYDRHGRD